MCFYRVSFASSRAPLVQGGAHSSPSSIRLRSTSRSTCPSIQESGPTAGKSCPIWHSTPGVCMSTRVSFPIARVAGLRHASRAGLCSATGSTCVDCLAGATRRSKGRGAHCLLRLFRRIVELLAAGLLQNAAASASSCSHITACWVGHTTTRGPSAAREA